MLNVESIPVPKRCLGSLSGVVRLDMFNKKLDPNETILDKNYIFHKLN